MHTNVRGYILTQLILFITYSFYNRYIYSPHGLWHTSLDFQKLYTPPYSDFNIYIFAKFRTLTPSNSCANLVYRNAVNAVHLPHRVGLLLGSKTSWSIRQQCVRFLTFSKHIYNRHSILYKYTVQNLNPLFDTAFTHIYSSHRSISQIKVDALTSKFYFHVSWKTLNV